MEARAHIVVAGVAMRVDMHHADRTAGGERAQDRQADRGIAADRDRDDAAGDHAAIEAGDLPQRDLQLVWLLQPAIAEIAHQRDGEGGDAGGGVDPAQQRGLLAHRARAVPRAGAVGDAAVERHADQADIGGPEILAIGRAEEAGDPSIARQRLRIGVLLITGRLLDLVHAPSGLGWKRPVYSRLPVSWDYDSAARTLGSSSAANSAS